MAREVTWLFVFDPSYLQTGRVELVRRPQTMWSELRKPDLAPLILQALLRSKVDSAMLERVRAPLVVTETSINLKGDVISDASLETTFLLPYAVATLITTLLAFASSYMDRVLDKGGSRLHEMLLTALSPADLYHGKLLGVGALVAVQAGFWVLLGSPLALTMLRSIRLGPGVLGLICVYIVLVMLFWIALDAGFCALSVDGWKPNQFFSLLNMIPYFMIPLIASAPHGTLIRTLSFVPPLAPAIMAGRLASGSVPAADLAGSLLLLAGSCWLALRGGLRIYRLGSLLFGQKTTWANLFRELRRP
jgi:ABC-2 type transport system permease protein